MDLFAHDMTTHLYHRHYHCWSRIGFIGRVSKLPCSIFGYVPFTLRFKQSPFSSIIMESCVSHKFPRNVAWWMKRCAAGLDYKAAVPLRIVTSRRVLCHKMPQETKRFLRIVWLKKQKSEKNKTPKRVLRRPWYGASIIWYGWLELLVYLSILSIFYLYIYVNVDIYIYIIYLASQCLGATSSSHHI